MVEFRARKDGTFDEGGVRYSCYALYANDVLFGVLGIGEDDRYFFDASDGMFQAHVRETLTGDMCLRTMLTEIKYTFMAEYF